MTRLFVIASAIAFGSPAWADVPVGIAERVAHFVLDGCDYLHKNSIQPFKPHPPHQKLAAHFGRIVRTQKRGIGIEYVLKTPAFESWDIAYWERGVDVKLPPPVAITMGDLQQYLGPDQDLDVDYAMSATTTGDEREFEERVFEPPGHGVCRVFVDTQTNRKLGAARRVFSLRFTN